MQLYQQYGQVVDKLPLHQFRAARKCVRYSVWYRYCSYLNAIIHGLSLYIITEGAPCIAKYDHLTRDDLVIV